jgi:hypothetical protein
MDTLDRVNDHANNSSVLKDVSAPKGALYNYDSTPTLVCVPTGK